MSFLLYTPKADHYGVRLMRVVISRVGLEKMELYHDLIRFAVRLSRPGKDRTIVILLATSGENLSEMLSISDFLMDTRIILILPDRNTRTIEMGHFLRPRYLTFSDNGFEDVAAVLKKMIENRECEKQAETNKEIFI